MAWIDLPDDDATPQLKRLTAPWTKQGRPVASVIAVMKISPPAFKAVMRMNSAVTFGGSSLGQRREELIATTVSALNECFY